MALAVEVQGVGPDLVLLHGWGLNRAVWSGLAENLSETFCLHLVDLPGHGDSGFEAQHSLESWADAVLSVVPAQAYWVGWSLGGLVALRAATRQSGRIVKLVLLASSPRFVSSPGWCNAIDGEVLRDFFTQLEQDYDKTLQRFLALQVMGSSQAGQTLRQLRQRLREKPSPDLRALQTGLSILRDTDLRPAMTAVSIPLYWLLGGRDTLVPDVVARQYPDIPARVIEGAGHAPFLSHPQQCVDALTQWLADDVPRVRHG